MARVPLLSTQNHLSNLFLRSFLSKNFVHYAVTRLMLFYRSLRCNTFEINNIFFLRNVISVCVTLEIRATGEKHVSPASQKLTDGKEVKTQSLRKDSSRSDMEENQTKTKNRLEGCDNEEGRGSKQVQRQETPPKRVSAEPNEAPLMTYVDPNTGKVLQKPENEVPNSAEVLEPYDEYGVDDFEDPHVDGGLTSFRSKRTNRGEKTVSFAAPGLDLLRHPRRNQRQLPNYYTSGRDSPTLRSPNKSGMVFKETVVPIYESNRQGDLFSRTSKNATGVSPLTIFALARSRRENAAKAAIERRHSADGRLRKKQGRTGNATLNGEDGNVDDFELNEDVIARLMDKMDLQSPDDRESVSSLRPPSVRKSDSTLMRWCIGALKKKEREIMFPSKPSRPSSSPSVLKGKSLKQGAGRICLFHVVGEFLLFVCLFVFLIFEGSSFIS